MTKSLASTKFVKVRTKITILPTPQVYGKMLDIILLGSLLRMVLFQLAPKEDKTCTTL